MSWLSEKRGRRGLTRVARTRSCGREESRDASMLCEAWESDEVGSLEGSSVVVGGCDEYPIQSSLVFRSIHFSSYVVVRSGRRKKEADGNTSGGNERVICQRIECLQASNQSSPHPSFHRLPPPLSSGSDDRVSEAMCQSNTIDTEKRESAPLAPEVRYNQLDLLLLTSAHKLRPPRRVSY